MFNHNEDNGQESGGGIGGGKIIASAKALKDTIELVKVNTLMNAKALVDTKVPGDAKAPVKEQILFPPLPKKITICYLV